MVIMEEYRLINVYRNNLVLYSNVRILNDSLLLLIFIMYKCYFLQVANLILHKEMFPYFLMSNDLIVNWIRSMNWVKKRKHLILWLAGKVIYLFSIQISLQKFAKLVQYKHYIHVDVVRQWKEFAFCAYVKMCDLIILYA